MAPDERAAKGVFLAFQYPVEIPGVATMNFLRTALNAQRKARGEDRCLRARLPAGRCVRSPTSLNIPQDMLKRGVNVGFSGGEKKRNEVLQMALFEPNLCILDEMDSGLDIDALRVAADGVNALRSPDRAMIVITHYQRLLNYIVPDHVHVMSKGRVVKSGGKELALELEGTATRSSKTQRPEWDNMNVVAKTRRQARVLAEQFAQRTAGCPAARRWRRCARGRSTFRAKGLPHRRIEDWKYTDLRALMREVAPPAPAPDKAALAQAAKLVKKRSVRVIRRSWSSLTASSRQTFPI